MLLLQITLALLPIVLCRPSDQHQLQAIPPKLFSTAADSDAAPPVPLKIAIIGSGIVGSTAAFTIAENARQNSKAPPVSITIFEQNAIIGGRITTTRVFDQDELAIDTCAATFNAALDVCVAQLARQTGLTPTFVAPLDNGTAIWNGKEVVGQIEDTGFRDLARTSEFKKARFEVRYGSSPFSAGRNIQVFYTTLGNTLFRSLSQAVSSGGLNESLVRGACEGGNNVLCNEQPQSEVYLREVIEAGVRDRFFGDYDELNELNSVLGLVDQVNLQSIAGGNLRLVDRLIKISNAGLLLNTKVKYLEPSGNGKWNVFSSPMDGKTGNVGTFDKVIIASPLSLTDLEIRPGVPTQPQLQFADTVVTHFTTRWNLNGTYFGTGSPVPQNILTSATATRSGNRAEIPVFSLRLLDNRIQPVNSTSTADSFQKLYKIVSSKNISVAEITQYLEPRDARDRLQPAVTWMHREYLPKSVPRLDRALKIQDEIEIQPGLFYAGNGAQVTDTIEFGCRMGKNAARLIIDTPVRFNPGNG